MASSESQRSLIRFFARHKVASTLLIAIVLLLGGYSLFRLNVRFLPPLQINSVAAAIQWPGASPKDVEHSITTPVEVSLKTLVGVKQVRSFSMNGLSYFIIEFKTGTSMSDALDEVRNKISLVRNLPRESLKPVIEKADVDERIARIVVTSSDGASRLRHYANEFERQLLNQPGISKVDVNGMPKIVMSVELSPLQMVSLRKTLSDVGQRIEQDNSDISAGIFGERSGGRQLRGVGELNTINDLEQSLLRFDDTPMLTKLMNLSALNEGLEQSPQLVYFQGKPAVSFTVFRTKNQNALESAHSVYQWKQRIESQLPQGMQVTVYEEFWQLIQGRINILLKNGATGLALIFVLLFLFLNSRVAFWVALSIPISISAALFMLVLLGGSINMISLFAMIMSLGIIVDDTIVVAEQAVTEFESGMPALQAVILGARKMLVPILTSSLTTVAAFLPLLLLTGVFGEVLIAIPRVVICVILASLVECFLILPMHLKFSLLKTKQSSGKDTLALRIRRGFDQFRFGVFRRWVTAAVKHSHLTLSVGLSSFILMVGVLIGGYVNFNFFPSPSGRVVDVNLNFTAGTPTSIMVRELNRVDAKVRDVAHKLGSENGGKIINASVVFAHKSSVRRASTENKMVGSVVIDLLPPEKRSISNAQFVDRLRQSIPLPPNVESMTISAPKQGPPGSDIDLNLVGKSPTELKTSALELSRELARYPGVTNISDDLSYAQPEYVFKLKPQAKQVGLTVTEIGNQLRSAYTGHLVQILNRGQDEIELRVRMGANAREQLGSIEYFPILTKTGSALPLSNLAKIIPQKSFNSLQHIDGELTVNVRADVDASINNSDKIITRLKENFFPRLQSVHGVLVRMKGRAIDRTRTLNEMKYAVYIALALIYILLCWVSSSYTWPLFVMLTIPFGLEGAVFGHWILGRDLTLLSLFGFFGLTGIVINDSIILLLRYKELLGDGVNSKDAIVEACTQRFRAVVLTSLTTIAGLLPLLFEQSLQAQFLIPMAVSICFGLFFSTFIILFLIPAAIVFFQRNRNAAVLSSNS